MEVPFTIARAVLFGDAAIAPRSGMCVDVVAAAKTDVPAGSTLDRLGGYTYYGLCENYREARRQDLLPAGLAEGCRLRRDIHKDEVIRYADVDLPRESLAAQLRLQLERQLRG